MAPKPLAAPGVKQLCRVARPKHGLKKPKPMSAVKGKKVVIRSARPRRMSKVAPMAAPGARHKAQAAHKAQKVSKTKNKGCGGR